MSLLLAVANEHIFGGAATLVLVGIAIYVIGKPSKRV